MSKKIVSAFLASHGSIDAQYVSTGKDDKGVDIYEFEIGCEDLPANTRLYMPNILGKLYYANPKTTRTFIQGKIEEWSQLTRAAADAAAADADADAAAAPHSKHRERSRSPDPSHSSFSDFIAGALTKFEEDETKSMFKLMDECDREDLRGYMLGEKMPIEHKEDRRKLSKAAIQKNGIKWNKLDCYIPEKHYNLTGSPGEGILVVIEEIQSNGTRTIKNIEKIDSITGRMNLEEVEKRLRDLSRLRLSATDEICFFDFACNTFNFLGAAPEIDKYWPNLLSYQHNDDDGGATIIHGTISKAQCERHKSAEQIGQNGVGFDDTQTSVLTLGSQSQPDSQPQPSDSPDSQASVASLPEKATPLLHVKVPIGAIPSIEFGSVVFGAGPASGGVAAIKQGGKRKHTKRKHSLKRSNRKRRVTRRRYNKKNR